MKRKLMAMMVVITTMSSLMQNAIATETNIKEQAFGYWPLDCNSNVKSLIESNFVKKDGGSNNSYLRCTYGTSTHDDAVVYMPELEAGNYKISYYKSENNYVTGLKFSGPVNVTGGGYGTTWGYCAENENIKGFKEVGVCNLTGNPETDAIKVQRAPAPAGWSVNGWAVNFDAIKYEKLASDGVTVEKTIILEENGLMKIDDGEYENGYKIKSEKNSVKWQIAIAGGDTDFNETGLLDNALSVDKTDGETTEDYLNLGTLPDEIVSTQKFTFAGWVNWDGSDDAVIFSVSSKTDNPAIQVMIENSKLHSLIYDENGELTDLAGTETISANQWNHVVVAVDNNKNSIYLNGKKIGECSSPAVDLAAKKLLIAASYEKNAEYVSKTFSGKIDEVMIFASVLNDENVLDLYNSYLVNAVASDNQIALDSTKNIQAGDYIEIQLKSDKFASDIDSSMVEVCGLPSEISVSAISRVDDTHARINFTGTLSEHLTSNVNFSINLKKNIVLNASLDSNPIYCSLKKADEFVLNVTSNIGANSIDVTAATINRQIGTGGAKVVLAYYDGNVMMDSTVVDVATDAMFPLDLIQATPVNKTGYTAPLFKVFVWDKLPQDDNTGGKIIATAYKNPDIVPSTGTSQNSDLKISVDGVNDIVTLEGRFEGKANGEYLSVYVSCGEANEYFNEIPVGDNGIFSHSYKLKERHEGVERKVYVTDGVTAKRDKFIYYSQSETNRLLSLAVNANDAETLKTTVGNGYALGVSSELGAVNSLTTTKEQFWTELVSELDADDGLEEFKTKFNQVKEEMTFVEGINIETDVTQMKNTIEGNVQKLGLGGYLNVNSNGKQDYDTYKNEIAAKMIDDTYLSLEGIKTGFENALFTSVFNNIDYTNKSLMKEKLIKYQTEIGVSSDFYGDKIDTYVKYMMNISFADKADIAAKAIIAKNSGDAEQPYNPPYQNDNGVRDGVYINVNGGNKEPIISAEEANAPFNDLASVEWAREAIEALAQKNVISGKEEKKFAPNDMVTRAEFAKMVVLAFGTYNEGIVNDSFKDVTSENWFYPYVANAVDRKIILGDDNGCFSPNKNITRQDMCVIIYRQLTASGKEIKGSINFSDADKISTYAIDAVAALQEAGIVNGVDNSRFAPMDNCTRAMAAKVIYEALSIK